VLLKFTKQIRECHKQALRLRQAAEHAQNLHLKQGFLDAEQRWIALALSYELSDPIFVSTGARRRRGTRRK